MTKLIAKPYQMTANLKSSAVDAKNSTAGLVITVSLLLCAPVYAGAPTGAGLSKIQVQDWVSQGEVRREGGSFLEAQALFDQALSYPDVLGGDGYAAALTASGYNQFLLNNLDLAEQQLKDAYQKTAKTNPYLHMLSSEYLGSLYLSQGSDDLALQYFKEAYQQAEASGDRELQASIILLKSPLEDINTSSFSELISSLPEGYAKARLQLQWAEYILDFDLSDLTQQEKSVWIATAYQAITDAERVAEANKNTRFQAAATAALVRLYYQQERYGDALTLADEGIGLASENEASGVRVQLNKLKGDCLIKLGNKTSALHAYAQAVDMLNLIKNDMPIFLPNGQSSVDALIDPVYRGYADLLLQSANDKTSVSESNKLLTAMGSMEAIKRADLEDFFLSRCSVALDKHSDWVKQAWPGAAVLYPIIFNDRVELILKSGETIYHHTVKVDSNELNQQVDALIFALQSGKNYKPSSTKLYQWLYAPIQADLKQLKTQTIVYVPDRPLRAMPLAALFDGKQYVVEQQAVVTLPSLELENLYQPKSVTKQKQTLIAGLSKPDGPAIDQLPKNIANNLAGTAGEARDTTSEQSRVAERSKLVEALSLPDVEKEVAEISGLTKTVPLLNQKFTADVFKTDLESARYSKVHIASHGYFGKNVKDSFVMTYDRNLTLQDFEGSLETEKLKQHPLDLLALSACETAQGNDRMLLGFSGLAVKSNALTAVGSLWSINDAAALQFMKTFYTGLNQSLTKAQAMQQAQVAMIKSEKYHHPYFWSPFVLIGNWQ